MNRRDLLLLRPGGPAVLSCEQLFKRYLDSQIDGTTGRLFENLSVDLRDVTALRLTDTAWLSREDLKQQLETILEGFKAGGGQIEY